MDDSLYIHSPIEENLGCFPYRERYWFVIKSQIQTHTIEVHVFVWTYFSNSFGKTLSSAIPRLHVKKISCFVANYQTVFQSGSTILCSHQQVMNISVVLHYCQYLVFWTFHFFTLFPLLRSMLSTLADYLVIKLPHLNSWMSF